MQKLAVIRKLVREGKTKAWVVWFLRTRTGLMTMPTARGLVEDAFLEEPKGEIGDAPGVFYSIHSKSLSGILSRKMKGKGCGRKNVLPLPSLNGCGSE